jgi:hypothetical protein
VPEKGISRTDEPWIKLSIIACSHGSSRDQLLPQRRVVWIKWALVSALPLVVAAILVTWWIARGAPPPSPPSLSVLIADYQNLTGDPVFNGTLESYAASALERASFVTRLIAAMRALSEV